MEARQAELQHIREYNHPPKGASPCPMCNGSGHMMVIWSSPKYYSGLLVACPRCNYYNMTDPGFWWPEALPKVQQEYDQAVREHTGGAA